MPATSTISKTTTATYKANLTGCEGDRLNLTCSGVDRIHILDAFYGRTTPSICGVSSCIASGLSLIVCATIINNCTNANAITIVQNACNNRQSCSILINNATFGIDKCVGIYKYSLIAYTCY